MFDIGWTEMLVVAIVAILFVGPKELPGMLRTFGRAIKKLRMLAGDFQKQFDDALKEAELDGVKNSINDVRNLDPTKAIKDKLNPLKSDLEDVKKSVENDGKFDPAKLFDESKAPDAPEPVKVDVDAALERQRKLDEAAVAKLPPSSGKNAVPGFGGAPAPDSAEKPAEAKAPEPAAARKSAASTSSGKTAKSAAKPEASAAKTPPAKPAKAAAKKKPAGKTSA